MNPTVSQAILIAVAVLAILFLIHRFAPTSAAAKIEDAVIAGSKKVEPELRSLAGKIGTTVEADAMQALTVAEQWLTDTSGEDAAIAKANAAKARKAAALRDHIAALQAKLPAA